MVLKIILAVIAIIILLLLVCVLRTLLLKQTSAVTATIPEADSNRSQEYGEGLSKLLKAETISSRYNQDHTKFYAFHKVLEEMFPLVHKHMEKFDFDGSLLFKWKGQTDNDPILFMSHHDVVEAGGNWEHDPFSGDIADGAVWGRGAVDTKASLYCFFKACEELLSKNYIPYTDIYLASSCTEEISGDGAPKTVAFLKEKGVHLSLLIDEGGMIIEEPMAGVKGLYAMVGVLEKGYGDLKFIARSNGGHSSAPKKNSPLVRLGKFMCDVEKHYPFKAQFHETMLEMFRRLSPNMNFGLKLVCSNMWLFKPLLTKLLPTISSVAGAMIRTTIAFTMAEGSGGLNVLPQEAFVTGNLRFIPHQGTDECVRIISDIAKKYDIETEVIYADYPCPVVPYDGKAFQLIENTINNIYPGVGVSPYTMTGGTDAKFYSPICENAIRFAPLYINPQQYGSIHALNENINCSSLPLAVDFYKEIVENSSKLF